MHRHLRAPIKIYIPKCRTSTNWQIKLMPLYKSSVFAVKILKTFAKLSMSNKQLLNMLLNFILYHLAVSFADNFKLKFQTQQKQKQKPHKIKKKSIIKIKTSKAAHTHQQALIFVFYYFVLLLLLLGLLLLFNAFAAYNDGVAVHMQNSASTGH